MFDDENTFEFLTPSSDLAEVLNAQQTMEAALLKAPRPALNSPWATYPWAPFSRELARFALALKGFSLDTPTPEYEILHMLSTELSLMAPQDLKALFLHIVEGNPISRLYRALTETSNVRSLLKNENALGWSGFVAMSTDREAERALRRRRMIVDFFREKGDWSQIRALEISQALALIWLAEEAGMISAAEAVAYKKRCTTEVTVRFNSWNSFAAALLRSRLFVEAHQESPELLATLEKDTQVLTEALSGAWAAIPWPEFTDGSDPVPIVNRI